MLGERCLLQEDAQKITRSFWQNISEKRFCEKFRQENLANRSGTLVIRINFRPVFSDVPNMMERHIQGNIYTERLKAIICSGST